MKIIPAVLAQGLEELLRRLGQTEQFAPYVQIDVMDGLFVPASSAFGPRELNSLRGPLSFELHLMLQSPQGFAEELSHPNLRRVFFHLEASVDAQGLLEALRGGGIEAGLALRPETPLEALQGLRPDALLFLTVDPCCWGRPFKPEVLGKVARARDRYPSLALGVDGGVSLENLEEFYRLGVDFACVGSRLFQGGSPAENYRRFLRRLEELEASSRPG